MDVTTLMRQAAQLNADFTAVITEDARFTFTEAWDRGVRLANGLRSMGVRPGDRVAGLEDNVLGCADFFVGCAIAGAVRVPLYPRNSREAHGHMLSGTDCVVVVSDESHAAGVVGLEGEVGALQHVFVRDAGYEAWLAAQDATDPEVEIADDDWFVIRHSGRDDREAEGRRVHAPRLGAELPQLGVLAGADAPGQRDRPRRTDLPRLRLPVPPGVARRCRQPPLRRVRAGEGLAHDARAQGQPLLRVAEPARVARSASRREHPVSGPISGRSSSAVRPSPTPPPSSPARSSGTPCSRATGRPRPSRCR